VSFNFNTMQRPSMRRVRTPAAGLGTAEQILANIISIRQVIASGTESAAYGDKRVEYRSLEELREILNGLEEALADLLGYGGRMRQIRMTNQWDKGL
jgi:hypothetical protein